MGSGRSESWNPGTSVIICCKNSATRLEETLKALSRQKNLTEEQRELIIVDNGSTDDTVPVARRIWTQLGAPFPIRIVSELLEGQALARRAGVLASKFDTGVFCDDDNWLASDYLDIARVLIASQKGTGVVGGRGIAASSAGIPDWFVAFEEFYAVGRQSSVDGDVSHKGHVWGAGMVVRLDLLRAVYESGVLPFVPGRTGDSLVAGDDIEVCLWLIFAGVRIHYSDTLLFQHFMPPERLSEDYLERFTNTPASPMVKAYMNYFGWKYRGRFLRELQPSGNPLRELLRALRLNRGAVESLYRLLLSPRTTLTVARIERRIRSISN